MKYFGTDGFRGEANVNLNVVHAYKVGRFLGWYYGREHKARIIIGKDTRRSSYMFEDALSSGLTASGADVYLLHVTPTVTILTMITDLRSLTEKDINLRLRLKKRSRHTLTARKIRFLWLQGKK